MGSVEGGGMEMVVEEDEWGGGAQIQSEKVCLGFNFA